MMFSCNSAGLTSRGSTSGYLQRFDLDAWCPIDFDRFTAAQWRSQNSVSGGAQPSP